MALGYPIPMERSSIRKGSRSLHELFGGADFDLNTSVTGVGPGTVPISSTYSLIQTLKSVPLEGVFDLGIRLVRFEVREALNSSLAQFETDGLRRYD